MFIVTISNILSSASQETNLYSAIVQGWRSPLLLECIPSKLNLQN